MVHFGCWAWHIICQIVLKNLLKQKLCYTCCVNQSVQLLPQSITTIFLIANIYVFPCFTVNDWVGMIMIYLHTVSYVSVPIGLLVIAFGWKN